MIELLEPHQYFKLTKGQRSRYVTLHTFDPMHDQINKKFFIIVITFISRNRDTDCT